ncbi:hypothetical protein GOBAR_AA04101 [Gossypium barbadense]|uniref:RNase H type-1 domain-containing protein n=1 Tax=Gossypium barbadense TaxID=3634 RepID=A0A2P5YLK9_GOSBA|nr:hypothetical protein GOBAR_AA04101 [Gossypium barbadense]
MWMELWICLVVLQQLELLLETNGLTGFWDLDAMLVSSELQAKMEAIADGFHVIWDQGYRSVELECYNLGAINILQTHEPMEHSLRDPWCRIHGSGEQSFNMCLERRTGLQILLRKAAVE